MPIEGSGKPSPGGVRETPASGSAPAGASLSSPFGLQRYLRRAEAGFDLVPFIDFLSILLLFGLVSSGLVFSPGFTLDLPESRENRLAGLPVTGILTLRTNMILFDGSRRNPLNLEQALSDYLKSEGVAEVGKGRPRVLLVKLDRDVSMDQFLEITEIARRAGFDRVQVAGDRRREGNRRGAGEGGGPGYGL